VINNITKIPVDVLAQKRLISQCSIAERLAWAQPRQSKCYEDIVYSLLGMFDVHMPLVYGEGREKAFDRLRREIEYQVQNGADPYHHYQSEQREGQHTSSQSVEVPD
jgi:hypothetical protein